MTESADRAPAGLLEWSNAKNLEYEQTVIQSTLTQADEEQKAPSPFFNGVQELLIANISVASKFTIIYCKPIFPKFNDHINL